MGALAIRLAVQALERGEIVACPTEAVWGLSCNPLSETAVAKLLKLKKRDWRKGLILVAADLDMLAPYIELPSRMALRRARDTWPGPATWVFPATPFAPMWVTGAHDSIAVRVTAHPQLAELSRAFGGPLVSTSANRAGQPPALSRTQVQLHLGPEVHVLPGATGGLSRPTPIREASTGHLLRR